MSDNQYDFSSKQPDSLPFTRSFNEEAKDWELPEFVNIQSQDIDNTLDTFKGNFPPQEVGPYQLAHLQSELGIKWLEEGFVQSNHEGSLVAFGYLRDVSENFRNSQNVDRLRFFYESTIQKMPIELVVLDPDQRYIFVNHFAIKDPELRDWLIGKRDLDYSIKRGKSPEILSRRANYFALALETKSEVEWEETTNLPDGAFDYALKRYSPILDQAGEVTIVIGYGFNTTALRRAEIKAQKEEQLLKSINESIQEGIYRFDSAKKLVYANLAFATMMGFENETKALTGFDSLPNKEELQGLLTNTDEIPRFSGEISKGQFGLELDCLISCTANPGPDGSLQYDGVLVDVSYLKETELELKQKNQELEKACMELDRFIYSASHDLRAPLTSILGLVKIIKEEDKQISNMGASLPYVDMIQTSVHRLDEFVQELIHYYRNNRLDVQESSVDLCTLVANTLQSLTHYSDKDVRLISEVPKLQVQVDGSRLSIILNNLVANAIKYHDKQGGYVIVRATLDKKLLTLSVEDNGPGIKSDYQSKIFEMFYRLDVDSSGSGLGLYIVQEAVKKLSGTITLQSQVGFGSTFVIQLPLGL